MSLDRAAASLPSGDADELGGEDEEELSGDMANTCWIGDGEGRAHAERRPSRGATMDWVSPAAASAGDDELVMMAPGARSCVVERKAWAVGVSVSRAVRARYPWRANLDGVSYRGAA